MLLTTKTDHGRSQTVYIYISRASCRLFGTVNMVHIHVQLWKASSFLQMKTDISDCILPLNEPSWRHIAPILATVLMWNLYCGPWCPGGWDPGPQVKALVVGFIVSQALLDGKCQRCVLQMWWEVFSNLVFGILFKAYQL